MNALPTPFDTTLAVARGYLPRVWQIRGWIMAALIFAPLAVTVTVHVILSKMGQAPSPSFMGLSLYHKVWVAFMLPLLAIIAAPAGIREDMEQRTLPLILTRPVQVWILPLAKGLPWFAWGCLAWILACVGLLALKLDPMELPGLVGALVGGWWAQLAFVSLITLLFKRGLLWSALYLFLWENLVRIFPPFLQRLTFIHYIESLAGSRNTDIQAHQLLAQEQISTHPALAITLLFVLGLGLWALAGWKLHRTPLGLAGRESEG